MSMPAETSVNPPPVPAAAPGADGLSDRRVDVDAKQARVAELLNEVGCEGLLVLEPENFAWLTSGAAGRGIRNPASLPGLFYKADQRWLLCSNVDSQRLFDEEVDGLGFGLKEWPWHWGREQLLADLCHGRTVACDRPLGECKVVAPQLQRLRLRLTPYEQACYQALGKLLSHALEATCRSIAPEHTEREVAGQISHRLLHRGAEPLSIEVATDGRSRLYRHCDFTNVPVRKFCSLTVTARKYGLCTMANRSVSFGPADVALRQEHKAACNISATYIACSWPDAMSRQVLAAGQRIYKITGYEYEWLLSPQGHVTGRSPVEVLLTPPSEELFQPGWAVTWCARVGSACSCDSFLVTDKGPEPVTLAEKWPMKRILVQGAYFMRPDVLER
jgi:Xaa-Pro aminopeptidase